MRGSQEQGRKGKGQEGTEGKVPAGREDETQWKGKGEGGGEEQGWGEGREHNTEDKIGGRDGDRRQTAKMEELEIASLDVQGCGAMGRDRARGLVGRRERGVTAEKQEGGSKECRSEPVKRRRAHRGVCGQLTPGLTHLSALCITPSPRRQLGSQDPKPLQPPLPGSPQSPGWRATPTLSSRLADLLCAGDQMGVGREP